MYNALIGAARGDGLEEEPALAPNLNTETCPICCDEIVLGPHELVIEMKLPPGQAPRHFECGHALHADCFSAYVRSKGHQCPICAISSTPRVASPPLPRRRMPGVARGRGAHGGATSREAVSAQLQAFGFGPELAEELAAERQFAGAALARARADGREQGAADAADTDDLGHGHEPRDAPAEGDVEGDAEAYEDADDEDEEEAARREELELLTALQMSLEVEYNEASPDAARPPRQREDDHE